MLASVVEVSHAEVMAWLATPQVAAITSGHRHPQPVGHVAWGATGAAAPPFGADAPPAADALLLLPPLLLHLPARPQPLGRPKNHDARWAGWPPWPQPVQSRKLPRTGNRQRPQAALNRPQPLPPPTPPRDVARLPLRPTQLPTLLLLLPRPSIWWADLGLVCCASLEALASSAAMAWRLPVDWYARVALARWLRGTSITARRVEVVELPPRCAATTETPDGK